MQDKLWTANIEIRLLTIFGSENDGKHAKTGKKVLETNSEVLQNCDSVLTVALRIQSRHILHVMGDTPNEMNRTVDPEGLILPPQLQKLSTILDESPESLAAGDSELHAAALAAAKHIFDLCMYVIQSAILRVAECIHSCSV